MSIILDHQLREQILYDAVNFPITYFSDELAMLPNWAGPLHWHPDFEIATAEKGVLDYQVGQKHIILEEGDSIFVNGNILHSIKQISGDVPDSMPNIVFSGTLAAPETSVIYQKYILPIIGCDTLPFIVFRHNDENHKEVNQLIKSIYTAFRKQDVCYEMVVQQHISKIFEYIFRNFDTWTRTESSRVQLSAQIRIQKMLKYIYGNYAQTVTLENIAEAANISRSEAGRCFKAYIGCSPVDALIQYRLQKAHCLLEETTLTLQEISYECGFHSVNYFSRQFRKTYGYSPGKKRNLGK